jgi:hypothetical protein
MTNEDEESSSVKHSKDKRPSSKDQPIVEVSNEDQSDMAYKKNSNFMA